MTPRFSRHARTVVSTDQGDPGARSQSIKESTCCARSRQEAPRLLRHRNEFPVEGELPGFDGATAWLNTAPLTPADLRSRVVLVSFGTYTCINWIRSLPYVRAWADKYAGQGLAVVGVQTPEFDFEGNLDN